MVFPWACFSAILVWYSPAHNRRAHHQFLLFKYRKEKHENVFTAPENKKHIYWQQRHPSHF